MARPNLLATPLGRHVLFFSLYLTEGLPVGFAATAVATQMKRAEVGDEIVSFFVGLFYLPWSFKWVVGPFVDVISFGRFGHRRIWIVTAQSLMVVSTLAALAIGFETNLYVFVGCIIALNSFSAVQDVAIDALACNTLSYSERGLANGLMFAGAFVGQALGGAGILYLTPYMPFAWASSAMIFLILTISAGVILLVHEDATSMPVVGDLKSAGIAVLGFAKTAARSMFGNRRAALGLVFALLPTGAYALSLALLAILAVEMGLDDTGVANLAFVSAIVSAVGCVVGGYLSDRLGRRITLAIYVTGTAAATLWLAWAMWDSGWIESPTAGGKSVSPIAESSPWLLQTFWATVIVYSWFQGLLYGGRTALFMDVTNPAVAGTQFTAYMALLNVGIFYSGTWQGWAAERYGYPITLTIDALFGMLCIGVLPLMGRRPLSEHSMAATEASTQRPMA